METQQVNCRVFSLTTKLFWMKSGLWKLVDLSICLSGCFLHKHEDVSLDLHSHKRQAQKYAPATAPEKTKAGRYCMLPVSLRAIRELLGRDWVSKNKERNRVQNAEVNLYSNLSLSVHSSEFLYTQRNTNTHMQTNNEISLRETHYLNKKQ